MRKSFHSAPSNVSSWFSFHFNREVDGCVYDEKLRMSSPAFLKPHSHCPPSELSQTPQACPHGSAPLTKQAGTNTVILSASNKMWACAKEPKPRHWHSRSAHYLHGWMSGHRLSFLKSTDSPRSEHNLTPKGLCGSQEKHRSNESGNITLIYLLFEWNCSILGNN